MITINLFDSSFKHLRTSDGVYSITDNRTPKYIKYVHNLYEYDGITIFTDRYIDIVKDVKSKYKIAWLVENRETNPQLYDNIEKYLHTNDFDCILTYDKELLDKSDKCKYYPFGGSWILEENISAYYEKSKLVNMIYSHKQETSGHKLRHEIANTIQSFVAVDTYGTGTGNEFQYKDEILAPYMYSIVIENTKTPLYFSEKLLDCLMVGTIPIYYGASDLLDLNTDGILSFNTIDELKTILYSIGEEDYNTRFAAVAQNEKLARKYICQEDWIYTNIILEEFVVNKGLVVDFDNISETDPRSKTDGKLQQHWLREYFSAGGDSLLSSNLLNLNSNSIVFDVGGYDGEYLRSIIKYDPIVYTFEPVPEFYEKLKVFGSDKIKCYNIGLDGSDSRNNIIDIHLDENGSSINMPVSSNLLKIKTSGIVPFIYDNDISKIDLLKLNIEGSEYNLLESLINNKQLNKINSILVQFHYLYNCHDRRENIKNSLLQKGFKLTKIYFPFVWELYQK